MLSAQRFDVDYIIIDSFEGAYLTSDHLSKLGPHIAHINGWTRSSARERRRGQLTTLEDAEITSDNYLWRSGDNVMESE